MDWGQLGAIAGLLVIVAGAQLAFVKQYVDKAVADVRTEVVEVRTEIATLRGDTNTGFAQVNGRIDLLDRDVQAIATKAHDH